MKQSRLFSDQSPTTSGADPDGDTFEPRQDRRRLNSLLGKVWDLVKDGQEYTLEQLTELAGSRSTASVSARLRDLRKDKFGGHRLIVKRKAGGLWKYRVEVNPTYREDTPAG